MNETANAETFRALAGEMLDQRLKSLNTRLAELNESLAKHTQATALAAEVIATRLETLDITAQLIAGILARDTRAEPPKLTQLSAIVQWQTGWPDRAGRFLVSSRGRIRIAEFVDGEAGPEFRNSAGGSTIPEDPTRFWAELPPAQS